MRKILLTLLFFPLIAFAQPKAVVYDITNEKVLVGKISETERSIASITKLMAVYTVLKENQNLQERLKVTGNRTPNTRLHRGMTLTRLDLINLSLVSSDNLATLTLAQNFPGGIKRFVERMNDHAFELEMNNSVFTEPTGLDRRNNSTISDIVKLTQAVSGFNIVQAASQVRSIRVVSHKGKQQIRVTGNATSQFFGKEGVIAIKTGFTQAAGFCITILLESNGQLYNLVILGARSIQERNILTERLLKTIDLANT
jgi:serine-type D-Ala-D-Ala endopeptidase (penicillin-binding protein 7)